MNGAGKYNAEASALREQIKARAVVVAIIGGDRGHGMEVQVETPIGADIAGLLDGLAEVMTQSAVEMKKDAQRIREISQHQ